MKKTRFTETQIVSILKQQEAGLSVKEISAEHRAFRSQHFTIGKASMEVWRPPTFDV